MLTIAGCRIKAQLYENNNSLIYRADRLADHKPVILKMLKDPYPDPQRQEAFKREYEMIRRLNCPGVVKAYSLETGSQQRLIMVLEDFGGESLYLLKLAGQLSLADFLELAISITEILSEIHAQGIIHQDINPFNIVFNSSTKVVKLIDFSLAIIDSSHVSDSEGNPIWQGTVAYMSPEQTGRINRLIDCRTDFYSLGVTFYQLLTNQLPFPGNDPLELIHAHLAKTAIPPHQINPEIPEVISSIVMKLLEKDPETRYQSAWGIQSDLVICLMQLEAGLEIQDIIPGENDIYDKFKLSDKIYERDARFNNIIKKIESYFQLKQRIYAVPRVPKIMVLLSGDAGIGKSSFIQEIYQRILENRGSFISGKCQQNIAYSAFIMIVNKLIKELLGQNEEHLKQWRKKINVALGDCTQVMIDLIPELQLLIGNHQPVHELDSIQIKPRVNSLFLNLIRVFCTGEYPLIVFLDDLQWADPETLKLLELVITDTETYRLLVIGAYRDDQVKTSDHPLAIALKKIQRQNVNIEEIHLSPLSLDSMTHFIADSFHCDQYSAKPLAEIVQQKTHGNPYFIKQFLTNCYHQQLIYFDRDSLSWQWELPAIAQIDMTENVVNFLANKLVTFPNTTQNLLQVAACIGRTFDISTLATLLGSTPSTVLADLSPAIEENYIGLVNDQDSLGELSEREAIGKYCFQFQHQKLQTIAEFITDSQVRSLTKLELGRLLLKQKNKNNQNILVLVNYYNRGISQISDRAEKINLAELNLLAAQYTKKQAQTRSSLNYLQIARKLLNNHSWQTHHSLSRTIYLESIEAYYLQHKLAEAENLARVVLHHAKQTSDYASFYAIKIKIHMARHHMKLALETGKYVLKKILGVSFVQDLSSPLIIAELENLPAIKDPNKQAAMKILMLLYVPVMQISPELLLSLIQTMIHLCRQYGNCSEAAFGYVLYGVILCENMIDIEFGYQLGQLALKILDQFPNEQISHLVVRLFNAKIKILKFPVKSFIDRLKPTMNLPSEAGDIQAFLSSQLSYDSNTFLIGELANPVDGDSFNQFVTSSENKLLKYAQLIWPSISLRLFNATPRQDSGYEKMIKFWEEAEKQADLNQNYEYKICLFNFHLSQSILAYLMKDYPLSVHHGTLTETYQQAAGSGLAIAAHKFYLALAILAQEYDQHTTEFKQSTNFQKVIQLKAQIKKLAEYAPTNFLHKYQLLEAESAKVLGDYWQAGLWYNQAMGEAQKNNYIHELALAYELAADFYCSQNIIDITKTYLCQAQATYIKWQGWAKVKDLELRYSEFFAEFPKPKQLLKTVSSNTDIISHQLDLNSILKAAQTLSSEMVLETLLEKMMKLVLENAGAQKGYLLIPKDEQWIMAASGILESNDSSLIQLEASRVLETDRDSQKPSYLSNAIVNYVIRTQKNLVLNDAVHEGEFTNDLYILQQQPKSILCAPLINQGKLTGIIYLENNLATGAFTPDRLEVLKLVSSQAAIALENARLYGQLEDYSRSLEQKVKQRTAELVEATHKAEAASQAKSLFLANMSHELRTPLNAILGFTQVMTRSENFPEEHQENLRIILRSGEHLLNLINQVLDLSKIEAGQLTLNPIDFDLYHLLDDLKDMFDLKANDKQLQLWFERCSEVPQCICTDEIKLRQVLINLMNNAIKFTTEGGVSLRVRAINDGALSQSTQKLFFEIEDTGPGIAADEVKNLFQAFSQTQTGQQSQEGTGLGLAITASFVELMKGEITVESEVGRGTIFRFNIEVDVVDSKEIKPQDVQRQIIALEPNQPRYRILIVDDREDNRQLLIKLLSPLGFELQVATNGEEALQLWETFSPHLIWMDLRMPVMDGYEATKQIKATAKGQQTVIIALTASILEQERLAVFAAGCDDLIYKPFRPQSLFEKMGQYLGVCYIYEDASSPATADQSEVTLESIPLNRDTLSVMPVEWMVNLHQAALEADSDSVNALIQEIPESQASLAQALERVVNKFQFETIIELTEFIIDEQ
jgi:predicted ATPase/signal transduction histidine kinase/CheY-like chemotaxis protein/tRNA A-37 threonylcarbamoyl transferase component Bud32